MSYLVNAYQPAALRLNESDTVASVLQNIRIILQTRQGSVPLYREFGLKQQFVDKPIPVAETMMYAEIRDAIDRFEPRAQFIDVTFETDESNPGRLIPTVEVEISDG